MKKIVKCHLHYDTSKYRPGFTTWPQKMGSESENIFIASVDVEFEVPDDFDPRPQQIKALQEKQKEAAAAFHAMNTEIMRQINELQALEMTV